MVELRTKRFVWQLLLLSPLFFAGGCSDNGRPKLGEVTGTVRLDGQPLPEVRLIFKAPGVRSAYGATDESGSYYLIYLRDIQGAPVGQHRVKLFDMQKGEGQSGFGRIPAHYGNGSEPINVTVEPGEQTIDIELHSTATR